MKTKGKEKKRSKEKKALPRFELGPFSTLGDSLPLGHLEHTHSFVEFLLLKPSSLIKHEFKDIFHKNGCMQFGQWKPNVNAFHRIYI